MSHQVLIKELENRIKNKAESLQKQLREAAKEAEIYVDSKESATNNSFSKTLLTELSNDIDLILTKAREGLKGRNGSPAVRHFLREVKDKVKKMIAGIKEVEVKTIAESIVNKIEEAEKTGSFSDIESQVRAAIKSNPLFPEKIGERYADGPYVRDMYPDRVVISYEGKLFEMEYSIMKEAVILGTPKEVIEKYVPVTEASKDKVEVKETARIEVLRESQTQDFEVSGFVSLKEAKFNSDFSEVEVVLIEAGCNEQKKRYYPDKTIKEAASIFTGWKMYINHPTATEEKERPERNLKDWASTIVESRYDNGMAIGKVAIHDSWLRERLADPVARQHIGLSINTGGKISVGRVNGKDGYQIVEAIIPARKNGPPSVDWVTEAGARGRVNKLLESRRGGVKMELEMATMKDLKETRSDLVEAVTKEIQAGNSEKVTKLEKDLKEAQDKIASFDKTDKINKQVELVESILKDKKIPAVSKERIIGQVKAAVIDGDIKESITKLIEAELEYVNKLSPKGKIKLSESKDTDIKESLQNQLDKRAGVEEKKEEKE
ncbi:MAG: hypothetical protein HY761_09995 [Candidatus Omnitrophica bacterium]|nr:hypothetical protein [Candidatus Omnitrophota bacterium]